jgi:hypothetical protein
LESWLHHSGGAIAFTTYRAGELFLLGMKPDSRLGVFERTFARCTGLAVSSDSRTLLLATQYHLTGFDNALPPGSPQDKHDGRLCATPRSYRSGRCGALSWRCGQEPVLPGPSRTAPGEGFDRPFDADDLPLDVLQVQPPGNDLTVDYLEQRDSAHLEGLGECPTNAIRSRSCHRLGPSA